MVFGTKTFGRCDVVAGIGYVATKFFHICFIPILPIQSQFVLAGSEGIFSYKAFDLPMSGKSVLLAWGRTFLFFALLVSLAGVIIEFSALHRAWLKIITAVLVLVGAGVAAVFSYRLFQPTPARKVELISRMGVESDKIAAFLAFGESVAAQGKTYLEVSQQASQKKG